MKDCRFGCGLVQLAVLLAGLLCTGWAAAQAQPQRPASKPATPVTESAVPSDENLTATRQELFKLLQMSPKLTTVIARDPSLLANQEYVTRNNPALAQFLQAHPEIARNPEFYLFANLRDGTPSDLALERKVWPQLQGEAPSFFMTHIVGDFLAPFLVFLCILSALLWLTRVLIENRRWNRIFKLQADVHSRLLDKFSANEELLTYMGTEAGKRFLEAAPIPVGVDRRSLAGSPLGRVLIPLQLGVVLALVGIGFLYLRSSVPDAATALLVFGVLALMLGIGFMISAGLSWALARHLGLLPQNNDAQKENGSSLAAKGQM